MKNITFTMALLLVMTSSYSNNCNIYSLIPLTQDEIENLQFLREEEKLARDVYLFSYDKYGIRIFDNISRSEQIHMDSILNLLKKYGLNDSASTLRGVFNNKDLQALYNSLTAQSAISLTEAIKVGATIEDLDIKDIDVFIKNTTKSDLISVYDYLVCGSKNHIRAFSNQLIFRKLTYKPQYIKNEYYNSILNKSDGGCNQIK